MLLLVSKNLAYNTFMFHARRPINEANRSDLKKETAFSLFAIQSVPWLENRRLDLKDMGITGKTGSKECRSW